MKSSFVIPVDAVDVVLGSRVRCPGSGSSYAGKLVASYAGRYATAGINRRYPMIRVQVMEVLGVEHCIDCSSVTDTAF